MLENMLLNSLSSLSFLRVGRLAQSVEHLTFNQGVTGSNPVAPTTLHLKTKNLRMLKASG